MKKVFALVSAAALSLGLFYSCTKTGTEDPVTVDPAQEVSGTYSGTLTVTVFGSPTPIEKDITITKSGEGTVDLQIADFEFMSMPLGTITLSDCEVTEAGEDSYTLSSEQTISLELVGECGVSMSGTYSGNGELTMDLSISVTTPIEMTVAVNFEGSKGGQAAE